MVASAPLDIIQGVPVSFLSFVCARARAPVAAPLTDDFRTP
jgi:hypothetical protein